MPRTDPESRKAYDRAYAWAHRDVRNARAAAWRVANPRRVLMYAALIRDSRRVDRQIERFRHAYPG